MKLFDWRAALLALACAAVLPLAPPAVAQTGAVYTQGVITTQNLVPAGVATAGSSVDVIAADRGSISVQVVGTYTGALSIQLTSDSTNWVTASAATTVTNAATGAQTATIPSATPGLYVVSTTSATRIRVTALAAVTGSATVSLRTNAASLLAATAAGGGGGGAATVADGADVAEGSTADAATTAGAAGTVSAKLRLVTSQLANIPATGQALAANSTPVVLTAAQVTALSPLATQPVSGTVTVANPTAVGLTDTQLRASAVPISLATAPTTPVTGTFFQATQPVSLVTAPTTPVTGTFFQATQPISGTVTVSNPTAAGLTDTQLRATAVPISLASAPTTPVTGTFWQATQPVSIAGTVTVTNPSAPGLTDTQLRATAVPISAATLPLPTGASTETTLAAASAKLVVGSVSTANSTTTPLGGSATFTGTGEDVSTWTDVRVSVFADVAGTVLMEQSQDGTNWDLSDSYAVPAGSNKQYSVGAGAKFFRAIYNNGAGAQSAFRLQTIYKLGHPKSSSVQPSDARANANDMEEGLSYQMAYDEATDSWTRQRTLGYVTGSITTQNLVPAGVATAGSVVEIPTYGAASLVIQITGTYTGALSLQFTTDGTNWITCATGQCLTNLNSGAMTSTIASAAVGIFQAGIAGVTRVRVSGLATITGTVVVTLRTAMAASAAVVTAALPTGTNSIGNLGTVTTVTTTGTVTTLANGQTAHSSVSTGSPVRVGGRVQTAVDTTLVATDASDLFMTTGGAAVVKPYAVPNVDWQATSGITALATTTSTALKTAGAAGVRNYATGCQFVNTSATVSTTVSLLDGATVIWTSFLPATTAALPVVAIMPVFPTPLQGTAATAMNVQLGTTLAAVYYNCQGYQAP